MASERAALSEARGRVDIARPVEERSRGIAGALGCVAIFAGLVGATIWRPSVLGFPDSMLFFVCAATVTIGVAALAFALFGGEWVVSFETASGTVRRELRTFGNFAVVDGFVFEELGGLCAVRDDEGDGSYRLFMVEAENGRPVALGDFGDEMEMRRAVKAIATVHPGTRVG